MQGGPFDNEAVGTRGQLSLHDSEAVDFDQGFLSTIQRVEVRRTVVIEVHPNDDPVEAAQLRHAEP